MRRRFDRQGLLALQPQAFMGMFVEAPAPERVAVLAGDVAIVDITGPLVHHAGGWEDSYEGIVDRVTVALAAQEARAVVLRIDSPGGLMHGVFDAARTIRERAQAAGKPLISWITGDGCSAAYALACAAETIQTSPSACVGSIGILSARVDMTSADAALGVGYTMVQSGRRKAYGSPHVHMTPAEMTVAQAQVDALAEVFYETVSALRPRLSRQVLDELEAGIFVGAEAVRLGLADGVAGDLQAAVAAAMGGQMPGETEEQATAQPSSSQQDVDDAREALQRAANDGDDRARRALAVLEGGEGEGPGDDEDDDDDEESASASASAPAAAAVSAAVAATAQAAPGTVSAQAAATFATENEELRARIVALEASHSSERMTAMLAKRKDLTKELRAKLRAMPYAEAKALLDCMPVGARIAAPGVAVRGSAPAPDSARQPAQNGQPVGTDPRMQRAFAMNANTSLVEHTPLQSTFRAPTQPRRFGSYTAPQQPAQAATQSDRNGGEQ